MEAQALTDLDLPYLALEEPEFARDPVSQFAAARKRHPWLAKCSFGYVITDYKAIRELLTQEDKMRMSHPGVVELLGAKGTPWGEWLAHTIQALNGAEHQKQRAILAPAFTPRQANIHRPLMRDVISKLLDEWAPKKHFDFELFASHFPITVMCRIIGASPDAIPSLRSSLEILGQGGNMDPNFQPQLQQAYLVLEAFVRKLVAGRRAGERLGDDADLLDHLLQINAEGSLSEDDLYNLLMFLFTAGYDTSKNILTLIMYVLLDKPDVYVRCGEDLLYARKVMEETLRYESVASLPRIISEEIEFRGVRLPPETIVLLPWSMVARGPGAVEDPDTFNPERPQGSPHMAFGHGPHICLGQFIARAQIEEGLHLIAQRLLRPKLAGPMGWRSFTGVWGVRGLPIEFETA
jgi:cytochrome P450